VDVDDYADGRGLTVTNLEFIVICEACHRQRIGDDQTGTWVDAPAGGYPQSAVISHGCCDPCNEARYRAAGLVPPSERNEGREV
jgi:hypothetical protein